MSISQDQIRPGIVVYLNVSRLVNDDRLLYEEAGEAFRDGPFVCLQVNGDISLWLQITGAADRRGLRLPLEQKWRSNGSPRWRFGSQYIHDARKPLIGPSVLFSEVSDSDHNEDHERPVLSQEGVDACIAEIRKFGKTTL